MIEIILFEPQIPQNTGNIGRICAFSNCKLHLIHPLGFELSDKNLRRAGMDYWKKLDVCQYDDWNDFWSSPSKPLRIKLLTTHAKRTIWEEDFQSGDGLLFGNEGHGAPPYVHQSVESKIRIPQFQSELRSLNLAVSVGIATYEALRQINR